MSETITLKETAERLGVHYMTAYRYVRIGKLPAKKVGSSWQVAVADLEAFTDEATDPGEAPWSERFESRALAGDERGSWAVIEAALASGRSPTEVYVDVIGPAMGRIGRSWARGTTTIAEEHAATAVAGRIVGRLSNRFTAPGRRRGRIVIGTPPGERHGLPVTMAADLLRGVGFEVVDLGCDLPIDAFVHGVRTHLPVTVVAVSITSTGSAPMAHRLVSALHQSGLGPVVLGGNGVSGSEQATALGGDAHAATIADLADYADRVKLSGPGYLVS